MFGLFGGVIFLTMHLSLYMLEHIFVDYKSLLVSSKNILLPLYFQQCTLKWEFFQFFFSWISLEWEALIAMFFASLLPRSQFPCKNGRKILIFPRDFTKLQVSWKWIYWWIVITCIMRKSIWRCMSLSPFFCQFYKGENLLWLPGYFPGLQNSSTY